MRAIRVGHVRPAECRLFGQTLAELRHSGSGVIGSGRRLSIIVSTLAICILASAVE